MRAFVVVVVGLPLLALGCSRPAGEATSGAAEAHEPAGAGAPVEGTQDVPLPRVHEDNGNLLFSFPGERGVVKTTARIAEVPPEVRARVLVVDVSVTPEQRQAHRYNYFADLTARQPDGTYPVVAVSRYDASKGEGLASSLPPVPEGSVVVYSAEWCGFCKKAKAWLADHDVQYIERDVEKQPGVAEELEQKLAKANVRGGGVPVIDWAGTVVLGFDKPRLEALLDEQRAGGGGPGAPGD